MTRPRKLTQKQQRLIDLIEYRIRHRLPMVQQDLAEALGIRRDSVNKLLHRARQRLAEQGKTVELPQRKGVAVASVSVLADSSFI